jgi:hypothetical protein
MDGAAMPIYEFYCPDNNRIYQFYARTLAQGRVVPKCPDNPSYRMRKMLSAFAVTGSGRAGEPDAGAGTAPEPGVDARMEAAMGQMEREFSGVDENDPRAMGRMMRRMADLTGERIDGEMEEVVRKLEEGADPDSLEEQLGGEAEAEPGRDPAHPAGGGRRPRARRAAPVRDPRLHDYP